MPVSQKKIAEQLGVSITTVSMALRDHPRISNETRSQVQALAQKLHYKPNIILSQQGAKKWKWDRFSGIPLAYVSSPYPVDHYTSLELYKQLKQEGSSFGYAVSHFSTSDYPEIRALCRVLHSRGIDGVLTGPLFDERLAREFEWEQFCAVSMGSGFYSVPVQMVCFNVSNAIITCWNEGVRRGYTRIGFVIIKEPMKPLNDYDKLGAIYYCQSSCKEKCIPCLEIAPTDEASLKDWYLQYRPDLVIMQTDCFYWALINLGIRVPQDVAVVSCSTFTSDQVISGMFEDSAILSWHGLTLLDSLVRAHRMGKPKAMCLHLVQGAWREGTTFPRSMAIT